MVLAFNARQLSNADKREIVVRQNAKIGVRIAQL